MSLKTETQLRFGYLNMHVYNFLVSTYFASKQETWQQQLSNSELFS